ncbi:MAG TPA: short-chain dehydrogenase [Chitinophagaceae bacterium]|nr:short-chain dehydrogenase [Chitinophagaceae bacterium]
MTNEQIEKFVQPKIIGQKPVQINFKTRPSIRGLFIETADYAELKSKNLWRIVGESRLTEYQSSKDTNLARIFNGIEITKLLDV